MYKVFFVGMLNSLYAGPVVLKSELSGRYRYSVYLHILSLTSHFHKVIEKVKTSYCYIAPRRALFFMAASPPLNRVCKTTLYWVEYTRCCLLISFSFQIEKKIQILRYYNIIKVVRWDKWNRLLIKSISYKIWGRTVNNNRFPLKK